jgi:ribosome-binding protein aMBF1 (putative translation factor)
MGTTVSEGCDSTGRDIVLDMTTERRRSRFPGFDAVADRRHDLVGDLVAARQRRNLSQNDVAARMGTSQSAVARLEAGRSDARLSTLERYADAVGVTLSWRVRRS